MPTDFMEQDIDEHARRSAAASLETGLKQAVREAAQRVGVPREYNGNSRKTMTGPEVIQAIESLEKRANEIEGLAIELATTLAGPLNLNRANGPDPAGATTLFDRMGGELMLLTRTLTSIEGELQRALGAVKP